MKRYLSLALGLALSVTGWSQAEKETKSSFSLKEAQDFAVENSYFTRSARMDVTKSEQRVKEITGIGLPQVNGKVDYNYFIEIPTSVVPANSFDPTAPADQFVELEFGTKQNMTAGVSVNQIIFDGSYLVGLKASKTYRELAYASKDKTDVEIQRDVTKAYGFVLIAEENYKLVQENAKKLEQLVEENTAMYEAGFMEEKDLDQIKILLLQNENILIQTDNQRKVALDMLKFAMGKPIAEPLELTDNLDDIKEPFLDKEANLQSKFMMEKHVDFRRALVNLEASELTLSNEKVANYPTLYGFLNYDYQAFGSDFNFFSGGKWYPSSIVGLQLKVPIFSGGQRHMKIQQAKVGLEQANLQMEQTEENLKLDVANKRNSYEAAMNKLENASKNLDLARKIQDQTRVKYSEGISSSVELTQTENQFLQSQMNYVGVVYEVIEAKADLDYALGNYNK
ncbi:TolC family protein [bacterium SCSIO 12741]|nr:TolC family protein [bacterium SCSIO 12741]